MRVVLLHPGAMGASVGASIKTAGQTVIWVPSGRSDATRTRGTDAGFEPAASLDEAVADADVVLSVCPPHSAIEQATTVAGTGFRGIYVDANAIAPSTSLTVAGSVTDAGMRYVDGGILGPPAWKPETTRLYLSGPDAAMVADAFAGGPLIVHALDGDLTCASALKLASAAWSKGNAALLLAIRAFASSWNIEDELIQEWTDSAERRGIDLAALSDEVAVANAPKAWRFVAEMQEIANAFAERGLPGEFHGAAAEVYQRMAGFKYEQVEPHEVIDVILDSDTWC